MQPCTDSIKAVNAHFESAFERPDFEAIESINSDLFITLLPSFDNKRTVAQTVHSVKKVHADAMKQPAEFARRAGFECYSV